MKNNNVSALKVEIHDLLKNTGKYHNKLIETEGLFHHGFEEVALYSYRSFIQNSDTVKRIDDFNGLWVESILSYPKTERLFDSLQNKFIKVKGIIDTTKNGHLGNYRATIIKTEFIKYCD